MSRTSRGIAQQLTNIQANCIPPCDRDQTGDLLYRLAALQCGITELTDVNQKGTFESEYEVERLPGHNYCFSS